MTTRVHIQQPEVRGAQTYNLLAIRGERISVLGTSKDQFALYEERDRLQAAALAEEKTFNQLRYAVRCCCGRFISPRFTEHLTDPTPKQQPVVHGSFTDDWSEWALFVRQQRVKAKRKRRQYNLDYESADADHSAISERLSRRAGGFYLPRGNQHHYDDSSVSCFWRMKRGGDFRRNANSRSRFEFFNDSYWENALGYVASAVDYCPEHPLYLQRKRDRLLNRERIATELVERPESPLAPEQQSVVERFMRNARAAAWDQSRRSPGNCKFDFKDRTRGPEDGTESGHKKPNRGPEDEIGDAYLALVRGVASGQFNADGTSEFVRTGLGWRVIDAARKENKLRSKSKRSKKDPPICSWCHGTGFAYDARCGLCQGTGRTPQWIEEELDEDFVPHGGPTGLFGRVRDISDDEEEPSDPQAERIADPCPLPDEAVTERNRDLERERIISAVRCIVDGLDAGARTLLQMYYWEKTTQQDIGSALGKSQTAVHNALISARALVELALRNAGLWDAADLLYHRTRKPCTGIPKLSPLGIHGLSILTWAKSILSDGAAKSVCLHSVGRCRFAPEVRRVKHNALLEYLIRPFDSAQLN
jgi:RNA polymerase sigma factor (sigma-70 family)